MTCVPRHCELLSFTEKMTMEAFASSFWQRILVNSQRDPNFNCYPCESSRVIPWFKLAEALNAKYTNELGWNLTCDELVYLSSRIFGDVAFSRNCNGRFVSWNEFAGQNLPGRPFTFWEWFCSAIDLFRSVLKRYWIPSTRPLHGFLSVAQTRDRLYSQPDGSFLLRFSESGLSCVGVVFKYTDSVGRVRIVKLQPLNTIDLIERSIASRILGCQRLIFLAPGIPKTEVFTEAVRQSPEVSQRLLPTSFIFNLEPPEQDENRDSQNTGPRNGGRDQPDMVYFAELDKILNLAPR